ncbi:MAG: hypothetical protein ABSA05_00130 [Opitutaceae bacterium]
MSAPARKRARTRRDKPRKIMNPQNENISRAQAMRDEILAAPDVWLPRRDTLLDWLNAFMKRAEKPSYELGATEADDLTALDRFLRRKKVPVAQAQPGV